MVDESKRPGSDSDVPPPGGYKVSPEREEAIKKAVAKMHRRRRKGWWAKQISENLGYIGWIVLALTGLTLAVAGLVDSLWQLWQAIVHE